MSTATVRGGLVIAAMILGLFHPMSLVAGGALFGAGRVIAAVIRSRHDKVEQTLDVATWIETRTFPSDTPAEIVEYLRGTSLAELRSSVADRSFFAGMTAEREQQRRQRSEAAKRGATTSSSRRRHADHRAVR